MAFSQLRTEPLSITQPDHSLPTKLRQSDIEKNAPLDKVPSPPQEVQPAHISSQKDVLKETGLTTVVPLGERGASVASSNSTLAPGKPDLAMSSPKYIQTSWLTVLHWRHLETYYRLNIFVILVNLIPIIILAARGKLLSMSTQLVSTAVAANITASVLIRQEIVVNILFLLIGCCPQGMPLRFRRIFAKIYHHGGVHSGAGIAAVVWFIVYNVVLVLSFSQTTFDGVAKMALGTTVVLDVLLLSIVGFSHPKFRSSWHNTWESIHRYAGWTSIFIFWIQFGFSAKAHKDTYHPDWSICEMLIRNIVFWLLLTISMSLLAPWLRLRKVAVRAEALSNWAIRLHFDYANLPLCSAPRLSDAPFREWHAFAGIPEPDGKGFSVIVAKAGDWTTKLIEQPPTQLWVRGIPVRGVLHIAPIFKSMVLVATGSGIGPVLSLLCARKVNCRILWSARSPENTYRAGIMQDVLLADPDAVILNTTTDGRRNLCEETHKLYKESGAEAVFVISNPSGCKQIVSYLEQRGVPAFSPIFDS